MSLPPEISAQFDPEQGEGATQYINPQDVKDALAAMWAQIPPYVPYTAFTPEISAFDVVGDTFLESPVWDVAMGKYMLVGSGQNPASARISGWGFLRLDSPTALALGDATHWGMDGFYPASLVSLVFAGEDNPKIMIGYGECSYTASTGGAVSLPFHMYPGYMDLMGPGIYTSPANDDFTYDAGYEIKTRIDETLPLSTDPFELRWAFDFECQYNNQ